MIRTLQILFLGLLASCSTYHGGKEKRWTITELNSYGKAMGFDADRGRQDAKSDIKNGKLRIIRYDMPLVRTGAWSEYFARFEELGIQETNTWDHPKVYCDAYNSVMDAELKNRFGRRYTKMRSEIMPPQNAIHWVEAHEQLEKEFGEQAVGGNRQERPR